jgi:hypothetical protein
MTGWVSPPEMPLRHLQRGGSNGRVGSSILSYLGGRADTQTAPHIRVSVWVGRCFQRGDQKSRHMAHLPGRPHIMVGLDVTTMMGARTRGKVSAREKY